MAAVYNDRDWYAKEFRPFFGDLREKTDRLLNEIYFKDMPQVKCDAAAQTLFDNYLKNIPEGKNGLPGLTYIVDFLRYKKREETTRTPSLLDRSKSDPLIRLTAREIVIRANQTEEADPECLLALRTIEKIDSKGFYWKEDLDRDMAVELVLAKVKHLSEEPNIYDRMDEYVEAAEFAQSYSLYINDQPWQTTSMRQNLNAKKTINEAAEGILSGVEDERASSAFHNPVFLAEIAKTLVSADDNKTHAWYASLPKSEHKESHLQDFYRLERQRQNLEEAVVQKFTEKVSGLDLESQARVFCIANGKFSIGRFRVSPLFPIIEKGLSELRNHRPPLSCFAAPVQGLGLGSNQ